MNKQQETSAFVANRLGDVVIAQQILDETQAGNIQADHSVYEVEHPMFDMHLGPWEWQYFVPVSVRTEWFKLSFEARMTIYSFAQERADQAAFHDTFGDN